MTHVVTDKYVAQPGSKYPLRVVVIQPEGSAPEPRPVHGDAQTEATFKALMDALQAQVRRETWATPEVIRQRRAANDQAWAEYHRARGMFQGEARA